jgi:hypothetical protein
MIDEIDEKNIESPAEYTVLSLAISVTLSKNLSGVIL